jgi:hypothetical protein
MASTFMGDWAGVAEWTADSAMCRTALDGYDATINHDASVDE